MSINELIINGGFETGTLYPWMETNAIVTSSYSHSGLFSTQLQDGSSTIYQIVYGDFSQPLELFASLAKVGTLPNPIVSIVISYFDVAFNFLGTGLVISVAENGLPDVNVGTWLEVYRTTVPAPANTAFAILSISKNVLADSAEVLVDDVSMHSTGGGVTGPTGPTGATGPIGPTGPTGVTGATGSAGAKGATGATGSAGAKGATGATGSAGAKGATGATGSAGAPGSAGAKGATGATGSAGAKGATGATGSAGVKGATGATGSAGAKGATGATGSAGAKGATGATGSAGAKGATGATGPAANVPTLFAYEIPGSISVLPESTLVPIVSVDVPVVAGQDLKIDYSVSIEATTTAIGVFDFEVRLYKDTTLIDTRIFLNPVVQIGSQSFQLASTQVDTVLETKTSTFTVSVFVTTATLVSAATANNRDISVIIFP